MCLDAYRSGLSGQIEGARHLGHLLIAHASGLVAHGLAVEIDLGALRQYVDLIESVHYVCALGKHTVLLPQHYVVVFELGKGVVGQFHAARQLVRNHAEAQRTERLGFGNHAPKNLGEHVLT